MRDIKGVFTGKEVYVREFDLLSIMRDGNIVELISKDDEHILLRDEDTDRILKLLCRDRLNEQRFHIAADGIITFHVIYFEDRGRYAEILKFRTQDSEQDHWFQNPCFISKRGGLDV